MNAFLERHFVACLAVALPASAVAGVGLAVGLWDLLMCRLYPALMTVAQTLQ